MPSSLPENTKLEQIISFYIIIAQGVEKLQVFKVEGPKSFNSNAMDSQRKMGTKSLIFDQSL